MGTFEAFYASPVQHPWLLWAAAAAGIAFVLTRKQVDATVARYCGALAVLSILDAWLSSSAIYGLGSLSGLAASVVPLFFVLAGDYRYLLVAISGNTSGAIALTPKRWAIALGLTVIVPLTTQLILRLLPGNFDTPRVMFFIYEVLFVILTISLLRGNANVREVPWVGKVSQFVIAYYSLWAFADLVILTTGADIGYGIRVVPNVLYYGGLIAAIGHYSRQSSRS
ncbi:MAG: hypothetical protein ACI9QQ_001464 [Myxococcota bacterium]|jgi:hypothetical protein